MSRKINTQHGFFLCLVLASLAMLPTLSIPNFVYAQSQVMPFDLRDITSQNNATANNSSGLDLGGGSDNLSCNMPPCPPGQACIQSCPQ